MEFSKSAGASLAEMHRVRTLHNVDQYNEKLRHLATDLETLKRYAMIYDKLILATLFLAVQHNTEFYTEIATRTCHVLTCR